MVLDQLSIEEYERLYDEHRREILDLLLRSASTNFTSDNKWFGLLLIECEKTQIAPGTHTMQIVVKPMLGGIDDIDIKKDGRTHLYVSSGMWQTLLFCWQYLPKELREKFVTDKIVELAAEKIKEQMRQDASHS